MDQQQLLAIPYIWFILFIIVTLAVFLSPFPGFRRALLAPWRQPRFAIPLIICLIFLIYTLYPWDFLTAKQHEMGSQLIFYLLCAFTGFLLLFLGTYPILGFADRPLTRLFNWLLQLKTAHFLLLTAGIFFLIANLISLLVFEHIPHIQDSISQLFQARIFATGRIHLPSPPFPDFFDYTHIINNGRWYSQYPWLHSFILMLFVFLKIPWIVNPLLGALTVPLIYLLGKELYDEPTARLATILAVISPFLFNMSAEYMNHASALFFATLFLLYYFRTLKGKKPLTSAIFAGLALGAVANIRPYTALALGLPFALYALVNLIRSPRRHLLPLLLMLLTVTISTSLVFVYNYLANGHPLLFGYVVKWGPGHEVGFGHSGWGPSHTPYAGILNTGNDLNLINKFLFEWPIPALLLILIPFARPNRLSGYRHRHYRNKNDWLLLLGFLSLTLAYFFYWFHNVCFGPRFLYESAACLILLTARGIKGLPELLNTTFRQRLPSGTLTPIFTRGTIFIALFLVTISLPPLFKTYHTYGGVSTTVHKTVRRAGLKNALVFCAHFGNGFSYNRLDLQGDVVYAKDYGYLNAALTLAYPDRRYYFANADTLRELKDITYEKSLLKQTLEQLTLALPDTSILKNYKTIIIPFADIPPLDNPTIAEKFTDYRTISREIFQQRKTLYDYTPVLALWLFGDSREHLKLFSMMDEPEHFLAGGFKFTLRYVTPNNLGAIYEITPE